MSNSDYILMVSGYRHFENYDFFKERMNEIIEKHGRPIQVVQGECKTGADQLCKRWCSELGLECRGFPADFSKGKYQGPMRNTEMLQLSSVVVAFCHSESKGTKDVIRKARRDKKILYEFDITKV